MNYFTGLRSSFLTYKDIKLFLIILGNKLTILIEGKGTILLDTRLDLKIRLGNILYSPKFRSIFLLLIIKINKVDSNIIFS
jgi:hypothetical protein